MENECKTPSYSFSIKKMFYDKMDLRIFCFSVPIYLFKVNNGNTRKISKICSKLTTKTPERLLFLTLSRFHAFSGVSNVDFKQVNVC